MKFLSSMLCVISIIFLLKFRLSSACEVCSPLPDSEPCSCIRNSAVVTSTTQTPTEGFFLLLRVNKANDAIKDTDLERKEVTLHARSSSSTLPPDVAFCPLILCNAPKDQMVLEDAITNSLSRTWVDKMVVSNLPPQKGHTLVRFPQGWLKTLRVKNFEVKDTLLSGDFIHSGTPFEDQTGSMLWFAATNCHLSGVLSYDGVGSVNTKGLNTMSNIEGVDFSRNNLVIIHHDAFRHPPTNLSTIILSRNSIQGIASSAFIHVGLLKRLDLSHNLLKTINRNIFTSPARMLEHIDLSWNLLNVLSTNAFSNMPKLKVLNLSNNFLTSMPAEPWNVVWRLLTFVDISHNFVQCDCSLMWLLPILSPSTRAEGATTAAPGPLPGQIVLGSCLYSRPKSNATVYQLTSLTRGNLKC